MRQAKHPGNLREVGTPSQSRPAAAAAVGRLASAASALGPWSCAVMAIAPCFPAAVGMILGVVLDARLHVGLSVYVGLFVAAGALAVWRSARRCAGVWIVAAAGLAVGGAWHTARARALPPSHIARLATDEERIVRVIGTIASEPRLVPRPETPFSPWMFGSDRTAFLLPVESVDGPDGYETARGTVRVVTNDVALDLAEEERIEVLGWLYRFQPPRNPGGYNWAAHYEREGIAAGLRCKSARVIRHLDKGLATGASWGLAWLKRRVRGLLTGDLSADSEAEATLLEAMILGQRTRLDRYLNDIFIRAGTIHFLAVSGIHVVIVMLLARMAARLCLLGPRGCAWAMLIAVVLYMSIAEPRPSILRAGVIALIYCVSVLLHRSRARLNWISLSCVVLLTIEPRMLFAVGFQLSYAAVLGVSYLSDALTGAVVAARFALRRLVRGGEMSDELDRLELAVDAADAPSDPIPRTRRWLRRGAAGALSISCGAWFAALPVVAWHFGTIHIWGAVNSVLVMPLVTIIMGLGFAKMIAGLLWPTVGDLAGHALHFIDSGLVGLVEVLSGLPGASIHLPPTPWWLCAAYYLMIGCLLLRFRGCPAHGATDGRAAASAAGPSPTTSVAFAVSWAILLPVIGVWLLADRPTDRMVVTVLSVGNGSAIVVELPDGKTVLCDAGTKAPFDVGTHVVMPYLRHRGVARVDRVYLSHANLDHFSGVASIVGAIPTGPVVVNSHFEPRSPPHSPGRRLLDLLSADGRHVEILDPLEPEWLLGGVEFEYLYPPSDLPASVTTNNTSTVLRLSYAGHSIMVTGDVEAAAQAALIERGDLHADVLVLPHHGGVVPNTASFIDAVRPMLVVRSSGQATGETTNGLIDILGSTRLYGTADAGAVRLEFTAGGIRVFTGGDEHPAGAFP